MAINVKMTESPVFTSQTKTKLNTPEARGRTSSVITNGLAGKLWGKDLETIVNKAKKEAKAEGCGRAS